MAFDIKKVCRMARFYNKLNKDEQDRKSLFESSHAYMLMRHHNIKKMCNWKGCRSKYNLTIDHILPLAKGGKTEISNLQWLCEYHNKIKTSRDNL